jgi:hypothetical protein
MDWIVGEIDSSTVGLAGTPPVCAWVCDPPQLTNDFTDPTLMALRVWGSCQPTGTTSPTSAFAFGVIAWNYVTDPATGQAVLPNPCPRLINTFPQGCQDEDWVYQWLVPSAGGEPATAASVRYIEGSERLSKARRRLGNDKGLLMVAQGATSSYNFHIHVRALIKE